MGEIETETVAAMEADVTEEVVPVGEVVAPVGAIVVAEVAPVGAETEIVVAEVAEVKAAGEPGQMRTRAKIGPVTSAAIAISRGATSASNATRRNRDPLLKQLQGRILGKTGSEN